MSASVTPKPHRMPPAVIDSLVEDMTQMLAVVRAAKALTGQWPPTVRHWNHLRATLVGLEHVRPTPSGGETTH